MIWRAALLALMAVPAQALDLEMPSAARLTAERNTVPDRFAAPTGVFSDGIVPTVPVEGEVQRTAYRLTTAGLTPLQVMRPVRDQIEAAGYSIVLDCEATTCGGYDFRFAVEVLPGPNMYVDIRNYHALTAVKGSAASPAEVVFVLTSSASSSSYVQVIHAKTLGRTVVVPPANGAPDDFGARFLAQGHFVLSGLDFESGTSTLGPGPFGALADLAAFLDAQPEQRIALVGHTDSVGGLAPNIALSKRRAQSVRERLISKYGIAGARLDAEGMGYLAPIASNLSPEGRDANRRVEAILLTQ